MAQRVGVDVYLGGLALWLEEDAREELTISREVDEVTGKVQVKTRTWPLQTFLDSPTARVCMEKVQPFVERYGVRGELLSFLMNNAAACANLTPAQIEKLEAAIASNDSLARVTIEAMDYSQSFFDDPSGAMERHFAEIQRRISEERASKIRPENGQAS